MLSYVLIVPVVVVVDGHQLILSDNSPVITGSTVTINATVVDNEGSCVKGYLTFIYEDDAFPNHKYEVSCALLL